MDNNSFQFLKNINPDSVIDIRVKEKRYGIELPTLFKVFIETFEIGDNQLHIHKYYDQDGDLSQLGSLSFEHENQIIYLNGFIGIDEIFIEFELAKHDVEWEHCKLLRIGNLGQAGFGGLYIGCDSSNYDEIWVYNADNEKKFTYAAKNIFAFIRQIRFTYDFSNLEKSAYCQLYKNWGEGFWRIKK